MNTRTESASQLSPQSGDVTLKALESEAVFSAEIMVTEYQKQYFYTETIEQAIEFVREITRSVERPFREVFNKTNTNMFLAMLAICA